MAETRAPTWPPELSADLRQALDLIRSKVRVVVDKQLLVHYTDHSTFHLDKVARNAIQLVQRNLKSDKALSDYELFVLLAAAYLHDVALQAILAKNLPPAGELTAAHFDQIRRLHGPASAGWIEESIDPNSPRIKAGDALPDLGLSFSEETLALAPLVAELCRFHSGPAEKVPRLPVRKVRQRSIRMDLLTWLLRVADGLDLDSSRANVEETIYRRLAPANLLHWYRHHYVDSVDVVDNRKIVVTMSFPPDVSEPHIRAFTNGVDEYIRKDLGPATEVFEENGIFLRLSDIQYSQQYASHKRPLPTAVSDLIEQDGNARAVAPIVLYQEDDDSIGARYFRTWGVRANPWTELPVSHIDKEFVLTRDVERRLKEFSWLDRAAHGEVKLVFGPKGQGKTTFMRTIQQSYSGTHSIAYVDATNVDAEVTTAQQLLRHVLTAIITQFDPQGTIDELKPSRFEALQLPAGKPDRPIVLIDNIDRFSSDPQIEVMRRFFELSQGHLEALKRQHLILISATSEWKPALESKNISYLGPGTFWELTPFRNEEVRQLIDNRLRIAGSDFDRVFEPGCEGLIQRAAEGNPRQVLRICQFVCKKALSDGLSKISKSYIGQQYGTEVRNKFGSLVIGIAKAREEYGRALKSFSDFASFLQRYPALESGGWDLLKRLLKDSRIEHREVPAVLQPAFSMVGRLTYPPGKNYQSWEPSKDAEKFLKALAENDVTVGDFVDFYRVVPLYFRSPIANRKQSIAAARIPQEAKLDLILADELLAEMKELRTALPAAVQRAWLSLEAMLRALIQMRGRALPAEYSAADKDGRVSIKGRQATPKQPRRIQADISDMIRVSLLDIREIGCEAEIKLIFAKVQDHLLPRESTKGLAANDMDGVISAAETVLSRLCGD